jgi:hypothetical protein
MIISLETCFSRYWDYFIESWMLCMCLFLIEVQSNNLKAALDSSILLLISACRSWHFVLHLIIIKFYLFSTSQNWKGETVPQFSPNKLLKHASVWDRGLLALKL